MATDFSRFATLVHGLKLLIAATTTFLLSLAAWSALAAPPAGSDPDAELARWFHSLRSNSGKPCCEIADCRYVEVRNSDLGLQAHIDGQWIDVPPESIISVINPAIKAVACYRYIEIPNTENLVIFCFVPSVNS